MKLAMTEAMISLVLILIVQGLDKGFIVIQIFQVLLQTSLILSVEMDLSQDLKLVILTF